MSELDGIFGESELDKIFSTQAKIDLLQEEVAEWKIKYEASQDDLAKMQDKLKSHYGYHIAKDSS